MRICLIEDNAALRDAIAFALEDRGFTLFQSPNGQAGLESVEENDPDLVITDMEMPIMGGLGVIQSVRALHPKVRIIAMSGADHHAPLELAQALALGADKAIRKPFRVDALVDAIADMTAPETSAAKSQARA